MDIRSSTEPVDLPELLTHAIRPLESLCAMLEKSGLYVEADIAHALYEVSRSRIEEIAVAIESCGHKAMFLHNGLYWKRIPCSLCIQNRRSS